MKTTILPLIILPIILTGCTLPDYERTAVREYDGEGNLTKTTITEHVIQRDPASRPLLHVLKDQTYKK